ncbi:type VII secretion target [Actinoplanes friuliensis]|uniref:PE domain-containing protein n=1 Tax=Actinoplanes friuliensis DSM 7358 TaxID=1246995 RepID=U5VQL8_9ACTN|nr:type VII secretion target [Actinoplanes friuliensis]AGZ39253.1 hypothetical protein AFR_04820 [Actinoplanes friuliensis DSM 7358]
MTSELEVDTAAVRAWAAALSGTAARISSAPPSPPGGPLWSSTEAAVAAADAAQVQVRLFADAVAEAARQVRAAADDYDDADDRAAARLRKIR